MKSHPARTGLWFVTLAIGVAPLLAAQTSQTQLFSQVQEYSGKRIALSAQDANTVSIREAVAADPAATPLPDAPSAVREKQSTEEPAPPPKPAQELTSKPGERSGEVTFTVPFWAANGLLAATTIVNTEMIARCRPDACQSVPDSIRNRGALYGIGLAASFGTTYISYRLKRSGTRMWIVPVAAFTVGNIIYAVHASHYSR
jgi:hypothetical protein